MSAIAPKASEIDGERPTSLASETENVWNLTEVVTHQHHVGNVERNVGPRAAHRHAEGRSGERQRVVDAVADHRDVLVSIDQLSDGRHFLLRQQFRLHFVDNFSRRSRIGGSTS